MLFAVGCSTGGSAPPRVPQASEQEHIALADQHAKKASVEESKYHPDATVTKARGPVPRAAELGRAEREVNPTEKHRRRAHRERALAEAHANAARHIDAFADVACAPIPPAERAACPLFLDARAEDIPGGVRIHLSDEVEGTLARVRCQLAFAKKFEHGSEEQCPLFVPGTRAQGAGDAMDLTTDKPELVAELRRRAREHVIE